MCAPRYVDNFSNLETNSDARKKPTQGRNKKNSEIKTVERKMRQEVKWQRNKRCRFFFASSGAHSVGLSPFSLPLLLINSVFFFIDFFVSLQIVASEIFAIYKKNLRS